MSKAAQRRNHLMRAVYTTATQLRMSETELLAALTHEAAALASIAAARLQPEPKPEPKPDFVMPGQIWRNDTSPTFRVKIELVGGPNAYVRPATPTGLASGAGLSVPMDGPRALVGYTRDHEAEQRAAGRGA